MNEWALVTVIAIFAMFLVFTLALALNRWPFPKVHVRGKSLTGELSLTLGGDENGQLPEPSVPASDAGDQPDP